MTAWASEADADKVGTTKAHLFVVSSALAQGLASAVGSSSLLTDGLVMGLVTDGAAPVAGATIARTDGQSLAVLYPNSTFTRLDGTTTSASGVFLVAPGQKVALASVTAVKAGWTFAPSTLLQPPGACFFPVLHP